MKITKATVEAAPAPAVGQRFIRDSELEGFALRVTAGGVKAFTWEGRVRGRMRRITLGRYPDLSVHLARQRAIEVRGAIAQGRDPAQERQRERGEITFAELRERYLRDHSEPHKRSTKADRRRLTEHFARLSTRRLSDIQPADVVKIQHEIAQRRGPVESNRSLMLLRAVFNKAREWKLYAGENPAAVLTFYQERARERFLNADELRRVNEALAAEPDWRWRAYFALLLLLGLRRNELLAVAWTDVDLSAATLRLPQTKAGNSHLLPLPTAAVAIIEALPSRGRSQWLFPARVNSTSGHAENAGMAWQRIRERAGVPDVRVHDLRRTLGSWMAAQGASLLLIGKTLNHSNPASTQIYARLNLDPVREALERNAALMIGAGK